MKEKKHLANYIIEIDVLKSQVGLFFDFDLFNESLKALNTEKEDYNLPTTVFLSGKLNGSIIGWHLVYMPVSAKTETIWHESLHAAYNVLYSHGIDLTQNNHEMLAYLQAYIVNKIHEFIKIEKMTKM